MLKMVTRKYVIFVTIKIHNFTFRDKTYKLLLMIHNVCNIHAKIVYVAITTTAAAIISNISSSPNCLSFL